MTAASEVPNKLQAERIENALGLDFREINFSWECEGQSAHQILVATSREKLEANFGDLWDSGKRYGLRTSGIRYRGKRIEPGHEAFWKVRIWDNANAYHSGEFSQAARIAPEKLSANAKVGSRSARFIGAGQPDFKLGKLGEAIYLSGESALETEGYPGLNVHDGFTFSAWINPDNVNDEWQTIYRRESGANLRLLALGKTGEVWGLWLGLFIDGKYVEVPCALPRNWLSKNQWHHIAVSYDTKVIRFSVNGGFVKELNRPGKMTEGGDDPAMIGAYGGSSLREPFIGGIDHVQLFHRSLTREEILDLHRGQSLADHPALAGFWKLNGNLTNEITVPHEVAGNRIVLLGGTLISRMEKFGHFEAALTASFPNYELSFRNLGWPADDVFGTARGEFGSAHNTRSWQPPGAEQGFGFQVLKQQLQEARPQSVILGYGNEAAYYQSDQEFDQFEKGYRDLVREIRGMGASLIVMTPMPHEHADLSSESIEERNKRLSRASGIIKSIVKEDGDIRVVDIFKAAQSAILRNITDNGVHLNETGYRWLTMAFLASCKPAFLDEEFLMNSMSNVVEIDRDNNVRSATGRISHIEKTKRGVRFQFQPDTIVPSNAYAQMRLIADEKPGFEGHYDWHHDGVLEMSDASTNRGSAHVMHQLQLHEFEKLKTAVIEKNRLARYRIRPMNKAYIFLFRRHEMGHLAYEMNDFEELVAEKEDLIASLKVPQNHFLKFERIGKWAPPREYPDHEVPRDIPQPDPEKELSAFTVAEGFQLNLFASDPMIANPINVNWDRRGRAWVSTSSTYPHIKPGIEPNDKIIILEDVDGDGVADTSKVYAEGLLVPHSVMPVAGGAYVCSTTEFYFLPDADGDDRADGRQLVFSGFGNADVHHMIHGLRWTPWGDLMFTQAIYINSFVETVHGVRRLNGSGVWTFRPEEQRIEIFSRGRVNPWGFALDQWGQSFGTDGAGGAGPHYVFPGSAFRTAVGAPRVLNGLIPGKPKNTASEFISGRHMPDHWQGSLLANDFRANRTVRYQLTENGSGYKAEEVETVIHSSHRSYRPVDIKMGPDGAVYVVDWYNPIIDHGEVDFHHPSRDKSHGRIWRLTAINRPLITRPNLIHASDKDLLDMLKLPEQYTRTQANRELVRRKCDPDLIHSWLDNLDREAPQIEKHRVEALWLFAALGHENNALVDQILQSSPDHHARAAATRIAAHWHSPSSSNLSRLAHGIRDAHPQVRLEALSALRNIPTIESANTALLALDYPRDQELSFALEMAVRDLRDLWLQAMLNGEEVFGGDPEKLNYALSVVNDRRAVEVLVSSIQNQKFKGDSLERAAATVGALGSQDQLYAMCQHLVTHDHSFISFAQGAIRNNNSPGAGLAVSSLIQKVFEKDANPEAWVSAVQLIGHWKMNAWSDFLETQVRHGIENDDEALYLAAAGSLVKIGAFKVLESLMSEEEVLIQAVAAGALAASSQNRGVIEFFPDLLGKMNENDSRAIHILMDGIMSREDNINLIRQVSEDAFPSTVSTKVAGLAIDRAYKTGRDMGHLIDLLQTLGGISESVITSGAGNIDRQAVLTRAKSSGSFTNGEKLFHRADLLCATCHRVNGKGGYLGPDLSTVGTYMTPESMLDSLINPSADIKQGYETVVVNLTDDSVISGLLQRNTETSVLVRNPAGEVTSIPKENVRKLDASPYSLMPPGLINNLNPGELADLMAYLIGLGRQ